MATLDIRPDEDTLRAAYAAAFDLERAQRYPGIDAFEAASGYALDAERLLDAARVLACPLKAHAPNWQHGRVIYSAVRAYLAAHLTPVVCLDIGTAKGFSALCLQWALSDAGAEGVVVSVDVIDPHARVRRNTVAEVGGLRTLRETLAAWPEADSILFLRSTGAEWLLRHRRVSVAFVDGKHSFQSVATDAAMLAERQESGDLVIFDDTQIDAVHLAIDQIARKYYELRYVEASRARGYAIGVRR